MSLKQIVSQFPPKSPYRKLIPDLLSKDEAAWRSAYKKLQVLDRVSPGADPMATNWKHGATEALAIMKAAITLPFAYIGREWDDPVHELIFPLVRSPHPQLLPIVIEGYARLSDRAKCAALSLIGAIGTREAAMGFVTCIRTHGWPNGVYSRVFSELRKLLPNASCLFPDLIELAGTNIGGVVDVLLAGVATGEVNLSAGNVNLEPVTPLVSKELARALKTARKFQRPTGIKWRFEEKYYDVRRVAGCWLDLAGHLGSASLNPLIKDALRLQDPRLLAYASIAALRHKMKVPRNVIKCVGESHENRNLLFTLLREIRRQDLFPRKWQTWDAFAAANMVDWLTYPTELGREPDELEKMAVFSSKRETIYLWRFRCGKEPWYAGVSGPYELKGSPKPIHGVDTFSRFDKWDAATAEQHLEAVVETLSEWRKVKR